LARIFLAI